jgi:riboflavin kinase/FMN adenylyltransferase
MERISSLEDPRLPRGGVGTIGNFDGLHAGHRRILARVLEEAKRLSAPSFLLTFHPHPVKVLRPHLAPHLIFTPAQKHAALETLGLDFLVELPFTAEFSRVTGPEFVREVLGDRLAVRALMFGEDFHFGHQKSGNLALLQAMSGPMGFTVEPVPAVLHEGKPVSSSRIRFAVLDGDVEGAAAMLTQPFTLEGRVMEGRRLGKGLGFPTVNLAPENELVPGDGIYAAQVRLPGESGWRVAASSIGVNPTFGGTGRVVEAYILDFDRELYGERVALRFFKKMRDQEKFPDAATLAAQIGRDVDSIRAYFAGGSL